MQGPFIGQLEIEKMQKSLPNKYKYLKKNFLIYVPILWHSEKIN